MFINDPWFYLTGITAALLFGISKGGFGGGLGIAAVPIMSLVMSPAQAAGILLPMLLVLDAAGIRAYWRQWHWPSFRLLGSGAVLGIVAGGLTFGLISAPALRLIVGLVALIFSANYYFRLLRPLGPGSTPSSPCLGVLAGMAGGYTSTLAHAGSPPINMYLLPKALPRQQFVATTVILFALVNVLKLVPYGVLGQLAPANIWAAATLVPFGLAGVFLGVRLQRVLSDRWFYHLCYGLLVLVGAKLALDGLS
ncbi:MAG: sulfite exporter TauE/SafE family protein [Lysobacterales bacterium]